MGKIKFKYYNILLKPLSFIIRTTTPKRMDSYFILKIAIYVLLTALVALAIYYNYVFDRDQTKSERTRWLGGFFQSIGQDWILTPLILALIMILIVRINLF